MPAAAEICPRLLQGFLLSSLALLASCAALAPHDAARRIADGVYVIEGRNEFATAQNRGDIGNAGYIVGPAGVAVIDSGSSLRSGEAMRASIAATTATPIAVVVLTQALPEYVLGASAFEAAAVPLLAQRETVSLLQSRCEQCLKTLIATVGEDAMRGTRIATQVTSIDASTDDGRTGRVMDLIHPGWAATPGDLAVFDPVSGVLFAGALVENRRIPNLRDGRLDGWIAALAALRALPVKLVVPGHGAVGGIELIDDTLAYLLALDAAVREHYAAGASLSETTAAVKLEQYADRVGYADLQGANVQRRYREIENRDLNGIAP